MSDAIDQRARDDAKDAGHKADLAAQLIRQHIDSCEKAHAENSKKLDKLEGGIGRVHGRIDDLVEKMAAKNEQNAGTLGGLSTRQGVIWAVIAATASAILTIAAPRLVKGDERPEIMPNVALISKEDMQQYTCPEGDCIEVMAFYDRPSRTIVLRDTFDPTKEYDLSTLLHEFVHHLQEINGFQKSMCSGDREKQAYQTQRRFLELRGDKDTDKTLNVDAFTESLITSCGEY